MKTGMTIQDDLEGRTFTLTISTADMVEAPLSRFDKALLKDIDHGKQSSTPMADQLLGLETIVRRIEEQKAIVAKR